MTAEVQEKTTLPPKGTVVLEARNITKRYGQVTALDRANLELRAGEVLAVVGDNGKALIFPLAELPEMPRGKGVKLQSYREGGLRDAMLFPADAGASWIDSARSADSTSSRNGSRGPNRASHDGPSSRSGSAAMWASRVVPAAPAGADGCAPIHSSASGPGDGTGRP